MPTLTTEIEITSAMLEAAQKAFDEWDNDMRATETDLSAMARLYIALYRAMEDARAKAT